VSGAALRRALGAAAISATLSGAAAAAADTLPSPAQALLHQAQFWRAHGRLDIARQALRRLLSAQPRNEGARRSLAGLDEQAATPAAPAPPDQAARLRVRGYQALDAGDLPAAQADFTAALRLTPRDAESTAGLGLTFLKAQRFDEAAALLQQASGPSGDPRWSAALASARFYLGLRQARAAFDDGRLDAASALATELARSDAPDRGLAQDLAREIAQARAQQESDRGQAAWRAGDPVRAEASFQLALAHAPQDPWIRHRYAVVMTGSGRPAAAEALMTPLADVGATDAQYALALYLDESGRPEAAAERLDRISRTARTPEMAGFSQQLRAELAVRAARRLADVGRREAAATGLLKVAQTTNLSNASANELADGLYELGRTAPAQALVARALAAPLSAPQDYEGAVSVLARAGRVTEARALIQRLADAGASQRELRLLRQRLAVGSADRLSKARKPDAAVQVLRHELARSGDDPELLSALGHTLLAAGQPDQALPVFERLSEERPDDAGAALGLVRAATQAGHTGRARQALARARRLTPGDAEVSLAAADLDRAQGHTRAAAADLSQALTAHSRARAGDLTSILGPETARWTDGTFQLVSTAADTRDAVGEALRVQVEDAQDGLRPAVEARGGAAGHSGDEGLSRLRTQSAALSAWTPVGDGRLGVTLETEHLNAGRPSAAAAGRYGLGPLAAGAPAAARTDVATALVTYERGDLRLEAGVATPRGGASQAVGEVRWTPRLGRQAQGEFAVLRRPVTDSLTSQAGGHDSRGGPTWGQVAKTGARAAVAVSHGRGGVYATLGAYAFDGRHVRGNASVQADLGGYATLVERGSTTVTAGVNLDLQAFRRNENLFTFGHGGYFSPQQFASLSVPVRLQTRSGPWRLDAQAAPGVQHYREGDAPTFPTAPALQARQALDQAVVRGSRGKGFGVSGEASLDHDLGPHGRIGLTGGGDTFGAYKEGHVGVRLRVRFGGP
jgi:tetratricopeptide (TPR) repeat protein